MARNSGTGKNPFGIITRRRPIRTEIRRTANSGLNLQKMNNFMMSGLNSMNNMQAESTTRNAMAQQMHMQQQGSDQKSLKSKRVYLLIIVQCNFDCFVNSNQFLDNIMMV